jgi:hypothetical protein
MDRLPLLSHREMESLLSQQTISERHPWVTNDVRLIEAHLRDACAAVTRATRSESRVEWGHYGSGYASFVDAWFYKTTSDFNAKQPIRHGEGHTGLVVLLSRLSPYFVFMEGEKRWHAHGGSSYLPEFAMLDGLETESVSLLARQAQPVLESCGLIRAVREQLSEPLPSGLRVPTILADRGFTQFDALFYWKD